ncbi:MAG: RluA family pseudouridine synthase [Butyrivibrio sp.]
MNPNIVYEDSNIIICNKPAGTASQSERGFEPDLLGQVKKYRAIRGDKGDTYIINRLDKPVGGLVLFALNKKTAASLSAMSGSHSIEKQYYAVVKGIIEDKGEYTDYLVKDSKVNMSHVDNSRPEGAKKASLSYESVKTREIDGQIYSLVRVRLHTGRHHQIRVQMAFHGHPIYGDIKYNPDFSGQRGIFPKLFAYRLSFNNPSGSDRITVETEPEWDI